MPHRETAGDNRLDDRLESTLGRLYYHGFITETEYQAGLRYAEIALRYLKSIDAPFPYGGEISELPDDVCFQRKFMYAQARHILRSAGKSCGIAVDRVAIYGEGLRDEEEMISLRVGLKALAGENKFKVIPNGKTNH